MEDKTIDFKKDAGEIPDKVVEIEEEDPGLDMTKKQS